MILAVFLFLIIYLLCCNPRLCDGIKDGSYLSRERTCTINAFMIISVFLLHAGGYCKTHEAELLSPLHGWEHLSYLILSRMGMMVVSTFLLFSGYGIMESMKQKGERYLSGFMSRRFWKVFYQFELGILCFFLVAISWGESFSPSELLIAFTGWTAPAGNMTWFIVVTLLMYIIVNIGLRFTAWRRWAMICGLSVFLYFLLVHYKSPRAYWYSTIFCFPAGMLLSDYRRFVENGIAKLRIPIPLLGVLIVAGCWILPYLHPLFNNFKSIAFAYGIALAWSGISFSRPPRLLLWIGGSALFCFYFYHILAFKLVLHYSPVALDAETFMAVSLLLSLLLSWFALKVHTFLDRKVFNI